MRKRRVYPSASVNRRYKRNAEKKRNYIDIIKTNYTPKVYCYLRVSTEMQTVDSQRLGCDSLAKKKNLTIDEYVTDNGVSGTVNSKNRNLGKLLIKMRAGDILICSELSRLSRTMGELIALLQNSLKKGIKIYSDKEGYELGDTIESQVVAFAFSLCADIERRMISARTKEGLARAKANGKKLGRPKGYVCKKHITDGKLKRYVEMRKKGLSRIKCAKKLKMSYKSLQNWVKYKGIDNIIKQGLIKTNFNIFEMKTHELQNVDYREVRSNLQFT